MDVGPTGTRIAPQTPHPWRNLASPLPAAIGCQQFLYQGWEFVFTSPLPARIVSGVDVVCVLCLLTQVLLVHMYTCPVVSWKTVSCCGQSSPLALIPDLWGFRGWLWYNVQCKAEHSSISCSMFVSQLWVSALSIIMLNKEINTQSSSIIIKSQAIIPTVCILVHGNGEVLARTVRKVKKIRAIEIGKGDNKASLFENTFL